MLFNTGKCKVMHLGNHNEGWEYTMNGQRLESVSEERDLGILHSSNMKSTNQCRQAYQKANKMLGLIRRTIVYKRQDTLDPRYSADH